MSAVVSPAAPAAAAPASGGAEGARPPSPWRRRGILALATLVPWVVLVGVWELAIARGWVQASLIPPPSSFIGYAIESNLKVGFGNDAMGIPGAILASVYRVLAGMALGFAAALVTGILISMSKVGSVDPRLIKTARTYGASERQVWQWVIFPAVLPQVFIMLRINFFAAWMAVLAAEMVGLKNGVGMMVILGREMFNGNLIMLGICIVGIVGYAVDSFLLFVQRKVLWWQQ